MDFLIFNSTFQVLICTRCQYALVPSAIAAHLGFLHKNEALKAEVMSCVDIWKEQQL